LNTDNAQARVKSKDHAMAKKAITIGQVSGLKLIEKDGSWNITVNVQRERVPANIEQWAFQFVAVAVMKNLAEAEKAMEEDVFGE
jgi:hypothetical protein